MSGNPKRDAILEAAEKIMSAKGLNDSSIAEIAKNAGVTDSVIYQFFKGKEDLLFSIAGKRMKEILSNLNEHLQGITESRSRLSKMIWFHLYYNDTYREYARLLLLECRSNRNFYKHETYNLIRKYAGIMLGILEDGVKSQVFRSDVNMRLVRDIIFGILDMENLGCLAAHETEGTVSDLDDIMSLIMPMITTQPLTSETEMDKRSKILLGAEQVFAEKGYHQATIADIARLANVAEGTVYEYFKNTGAPLDETVERFREHVFPYHLGNIHPRGWGWVNGTGSTVGAYADFLAAAMNVNCAGAQTGALFVEAQVVETLKAAVGWPATGSGILISGASAANLVGLAAARDRAGAAPAPGGVPVDVGREGVAALPLVLYASEAIHNSVDRAVRLLGIGTDRLRKIPVDAEWRMDAAALEGAIAADRAAGLRPFCVVATAGTVDHGAVDPIGVLADLCGREGLWLHVDGAFGAVAALSDELRPLVAGMERRPWS